MLVYMMVAGIIFSILIGIILALSTGDGSLSDEDADSIGGLILFSLLISLAWIVTAPVAIVSGLVYLLVKFILKKLKNKTKK